MTTHEYLTVRDGILGVLRARREAMGLSQWKLGQGIGLHRDTLSKLETGDRTPRLDTLIRLADALGLRIEVAPK